MKFTLSAILPLLALVVIAITLSIVTAGLLASQSIPTSGSVGDLGVSSVNVGVFSDASASVVCSSISWGNLDPGSSVSRTIYIKNTGNESVTLGLAAGGWVPASADSVLTLGWNREGVVLGVNQTVSATLTLTVSPNTGSLGDFSFNVVFSGYA